ncbi:nucleotidyltransferase domain-containing protein [Crenobacter cavernae]|uniref:Transcriptional regulator n=1 Tax=Crenobacter cavernae TaxID=2290923 RepID=A0A345Y4N4_9NEIS|nr:nucleotidyltransferase domain-containing protein [Crenobacter cavernae]AXK38886.1 transcriptional regulator [Crenobacter cavernae]
MGTKDRVTIAEALFTSAQQKVLGLLFGHADQSFYTNEIVRLAGIGIGSVHRELKRLAQAGLLTVSRVGNQTRYQANAASPVFEELRGLVVKTFGVADIVRQALLPLSDKIGVAFIYGSVAKGNEGAHSDIDVLLIGEDLAYSDVFTRLGEAESLLGRPVNPSVYSWPEWRRKLEEGNTFVQRVAQQAKIFLIGSEHELEQSR